MSGPLLDRMDIQVALPPAKYEALAGRSGGDGETSTMVAERVGAARARQRERAERGHRRAVLNA